MKRWGTYIGLGAVFLVILVAIKGHVLVFNGLEGKPVDQVSDPIKVRVTVDASSNYAWDGQSLPDLAALEAKFAEISGKKPQPVAYLDLAKGVQYEQVVKVLKLMQKYGIGSGIVGNEQVEATPNTDASK